MLNEILNLGGITELSKSNQESLKGGGYILYGCNDGTSGSAHGVHRPQDLCNGHGGLAYYFAVK